MSAAIELIGIEKRYGRVPALGGVSLEIPEGSLFGLIGPNGAGKTTCFGIMSGFVLPSAGEVRVRGVARTAARPPVGHVLSLPQDAEMPKGLRVKQALLHLGALGGLGAAEASKLADEALARVGLAELAERRLGQLSHGQRRRVGIAQTLVGRDEVILLDEPSAGLDPRTAAELRTLVRELAVDRTIVLSSHNLDEVEQLCTHAAILDRGRVVIAGTMASIRETSGRVTLTLSARPAAVDALSAALGALPGAGRVEASEDGTRFEIHVVHPDATDALANAAIRVVLEAGGSLLSVERGRRLEDRFLEATASI